MWICQNVDVYLGGNKAMERGGESEKHWIKKAPPFMILPNYTLKWNHKCTCVCVYKKAKENYKKILRIDNCYNKCSKKDKTYSKHPNFIIAVCSLWQLSPALSFWSSSWQKYPWGSQSLA